MKRIFVLLIVFTLVISTCFVFFVPANNALKADESYQWIPVNNGLYGGDVRSLIIDPTNSKVIYAGMYGGLFRSTDGGTNWSASGLTNNTVYSLAIDPTNTQVIYAGINGGVFKSTDGGTNWSASGLTNNTVYSLAIDPTNTQVIYVGTNGGIFKSTNGGTNWSQISTGLTNSEVYSLAIDLTNTQVIYAGTNGGGLFKSTNGGTNWNKMNSGLTNLGIQSLATDPTNTQVIYTGTYGGGIFKSTNGGSSWSEINIGLIAAIINQLAIDPTNTQVIYAGTYGGGIFKSTNGGSSWSEINIGLVNAFIFSLVIDPTNTQVIYSGVGYFGIFKSTNGGSSWSASGLTNTLVNSLAIDPKNTQIIYAGTYSDGIYKSIDGGTSWTKINNGLRISEVTSLAIDPTNTQVIYAGTYGGGLFKSTNGGANWSEINITGLIVIGGFPYVYSLAIDPNNTNTVYIGAEYYIYKTTNGGSDWNSADSGLTINTVNSLAIDQTNTQVIYAGTYGGGVFKSTNGGTNWTQMNSGLANKYVFSLAIDQKNSNILYAGTDSNGIYKYTSLHTITASADNGGSINPNGEIFVSYGDSKTFTITPNSGYKIKDVIVDGVSVGAVSTYTFGNVTTFHTIEASFEMCYLITSSSDDNGSISPKGGVTVNPNSSQTFTVTPNIGYKIKDVIVDGGSVGAVSTYTFSNITVNHTIAATFEPITYSITASSGTGGSISPSGTITVNSGDSKTFTITPNNSYKISNVKVDSVLKGSISTYTFINIASDHTISATFEKQITQTVVILQIGRTNFTVNGLSNTLDSPPVIKNSRTLLPIRAIIESLGGSVSWDATAKKVTVMLGSNTIELWIGKNTAKVNGVNTPIDSTNAKVVPEIINSRTMLPLRFITENLGATVDWNGTTQTITITYQAP
jgi:photosystem II stability/assembly factor-like uncharacterized protein